MCVCTEIVASNNDTVETASKTTLGGLGGCENSACKPMPT